MKTNGIAIFLAMAMTLAVNGAQCRCTHDSSAAYAPSPVVRTQTAHPCHTQTGEASSKPSGSCCKDQCCSEFRAASGRGAMQFTLPGPAHTFLSATVPASVFHAGALRFKSQK